MYQRLPNSMVPREIMKRSQCSRLTCQNLFLIERIIVSVLILIYEQLHDKSITTILNTVRFQNWTQIG